MNTDDNKAILEELNKEWDGVAIGADTKLAKAVGDGGLAARHFAYGYLACKRKYQQPVSDGDIEAIAADLDNLKMRVELARCDDAEIIETLAGAISSLRSQR